MPTIFSDPDIEARFRRDGYVVVPLLNPEEIQTLTDLHQQTTPAVPMDYYATPHSPDSAYRETVRQGVNQILIPRAKEWMPDYYPCFSSYVVKRGNSLKGRVPLHQDYSMVDFAQHTAVHIWCPLIDVDETNGCLKAVVGSHLFFKHISAVSHNPASYDPVRKLLEEEYSTRVPMAAGSAFIFDQRLLHSSDENQTDALRIAVGGIFLPSGVNPSLYMWNKEQPKELTVLEATVEYLTKFKPGVLLTEPYPEGVRFLKTIPFDFTPVTAEDVTPLDPRRPWPTPAEVVPTQPAPVSEFLQENRVEAAPAQPAPAQLAPPVVPSPQPITKGSVEANREEPVTLAHVEKPVAPVPLPPASASSVPVASTSVPPPTQKEPGWLERLTGWFRR